MENSKEKILTNIRKANLQKIDLPEMPIDNSPISIDNLITNAEKSGASIKLINKNSLQKNIEELIADKKNIFSTIPQIASTISVSADTTALELNKIEVAILQASFIVEENGALWITDKELVNRLTVCIPEYIIVVVEQNQIKKNMHQAYEQIDLIKAEYGVFLCGPSKTADIEQSLVIGAHGAKGLQIFVVE